MKWSYFYIELLFLSILTVSCYDEKDLEPSNIVSSYSVPQGTHDYDDVIVDIYDQYSSCLLYKFTDKDTYCTFTFALFNNTKNRVSLKKKSCSTLIFGLVFHD